jgi:hypothetical protein
MSSPVAINKPYAEFLSAYAQTLDADSAARTAQFQRDGFIELEDFVQGELWDAGEAEVHRSLNEQGGAVEYVRDTEWDKDDPQIAAYLERGPIERRQPLRGSAYLLRADTALHRVAPLVKEGALRIILCFSYASLSDLEREVSHESMQDIYPEDH